MDFSARIYTDIVSDKKFNKTYNKVRRLSPMKDIFLVTLPVYGHGLYEIYKYEEMLQHYYRTIDDKIFVMGIATSKAKAAELVTDIINDMSLMNFPLDSKAYYEFLRKTEIKEKAMENLQG